MYLDCTTKKIKTTTYALFDEAHYTSQTKPKGAQRLLHTGMNINEPRCDAVTQQHIPSIKMLSKDTQPTMEYLYVAVKHKDAIIPQRATNGSAGYDLHTMERGTIKPSGTMGFDTGIAITPPPQIYGRIASRSGLVAKHNVGTKAGVIDADYTGTLKIILHNFGSKSYTVEKGDRIAQLILEQHKLPPVQTITNLKETTRGDKGFAST